MTEPSSKSKDFHRSPKISPRRNPERTASNTSSGHQACEHIRDGTRASQNETWAAPLCSCKYVKYVLRRLLTDRDDLTEIEFPKHIKTTKKTWDRNWNSIF